MNIREIENVLLEHCYNMGILNNNSPSKKKDAILDSLIAAVIRTEITLEDLKECINDVNNNNVVNINFFDEGGNVWDYINIKWRKFAKALWRQRSVGLGTPNAASGEGELMFIFLSPEIQKPTKGDLLINGQNVELKGDGVRVMGNISGSKFREESLRIAEKFGLEPNITYKNNLEAVEIEKDKQFDSHWRKQLSHLDIYQQKSFVNDWLSIISKDDVSDSVDNIFKNNELNHDEFKKELVKILYKENLNDRKFDKFVLLGDGSHSKVINGNVDYFNSLLDAGEIGISSDYFRVNQRANVGWYIY